MLRTKQQNSKLHALITELNINAENKAVLVDSFTGGRETSTSKLTVEECDEFIAWCVEEKKKVPTAKEKKEKCNTMRRKILSCCHTMQWYKRGLSNELILHENRPVLDFARINKFCEEKTPCKKALQQHTYEELPALVTIFEKMQNQKAK